MPLGCLATRRFTMTPGRRRVTQLSSTTSLISPAWCISTAACCIFLCRWMQTHIQQHPVQQRFRHAGKSRVFYSSRLLHRSIREKTKQTARNRTTSRGQIQILSIEFFLAATSVDVWAELAAVVLSLALLLLLPIHRSVVGGDVIPNRFYRLDLSFDKIEESNRRCDIN